MTFLDSLDKIPGKIFPRLRPRLVDGLLVFPYIFYREIFHIIGSFILVGISHFLFLYGWIYTPIIFFTFLGTWMTFQEFYLHPKKYNQKLWKGILDWLSWVIPFIIYLFYIYER